MKAILPFAIIALCIGTYFVYISPLVGDINSKRGKLSEYTNVLGKIKELTAERDAAINAYNSISADDTAKLDKIIPDKFDGVLFLNDLSAEATRDGITLSTFNQNTSQTEDHSNDSATGSPLYQTVTMNVTFTGQFEQFLAFLKDVETNLQLVDVDSLHISGGSSGSGAGALSPTGKSTVSKLQFALVIKTYSLK